MAALYPTGSIFFLMACGKNLNIVKCPFIGDWLGIRIFCSGMITPMHESPHDLQTRPWNLRTVSCRVNQSHSVGYRLSGHVRYSIGQYSRYSN